MQDLPYPRMDEDYPRRLEEERAERARASLDPSDVLAELQHLLLEIDDDAQHPFWPLVRHCTEVGTMTETGVRPYMAAQVGEALLPLIDRAIRRLVQEALDDDAAWEVA
jgi:hypothetical protein